MKSGLYTIILLASLLACDASDHSVSPNATGESGSLARFALSPTHLYVVDDKSLNVYKILTHGELVKVNNQYVGANIETIHVKDNMLYLGAQDGMRIFDLVDPNAPKQKSTYSHILACDPVVVQDTIAFVTYRTNNCRNFGRNVLEIVNIKDPLNPVLLSSYSLTNPYGLGVKNNLLFVCEGHDGLKVLNISNPHKPDVIAAYDFPARDVIVDNEKIIVTSDTGVSQYSYTASGQLQKLSDISIILPD